MDFSTVWVSPLHPLLGRGTFSRFSPPVSLLLARRAKLGFLALLFFALVTQGEYVQFPLAILLMARQV